MRPSAATALLASIALAACGSVRVSPPGSGARAEPRPEDCRIEFLEEPPGRPYDDLGELSMLVTLVGPEGPLEALRPGACALGADAVIVTRKFVTDDRGHVLVAGTAIKFTGAAPAPEPLPTQVTL
jgi:hypothetical protein